MEQFGKALPHMGQAQGEWQGFPWESKYDCEPLASVSKGGSPLPDERETAHPETCS